MKETVTRIKSEKDRVVEDVQYELESIISGLKTKVESLTSKNVILDRELLALKDTIVGR